MNIMCVGAGYVGTSVMAIMAQQCPEHNITLYDANAARVEAWNVGEVPIYEPDINTILAEVKGKNLTFVGDDKFPEAPFPPPPLLHPNPGAG